MKQVNEEVMDEKEGVCPNCKHEIKKHTNKGLAECTLEFLKSGINK
jgi:hypothetical protein